MSTRLPRFKRVSTASAIHLTARDQKIIRLVNRHRFLHSSHILALLDGNPQQIVRRLQLLYHHGFLERPRCQLDYYHQGGSRPIVYGIGNLGANLLSREHGIPVGKIRWGEKNNAIGRVYLEHALFVSGVMVAVELACRAVGTVRLLTEDEIAPAKTQRQPFCWKVSGTGGQNLGVLPDRVFALEYRNEKGTLDRAYFFLEADRGTMPVIRKNLQQTSFYRKLLAYEATWSQSIHKTKFGFHRFRVVTVTKSAARAQSLVDACSKLKTGHGLFLFADKSIFEKPHEMLSAVWKTAKEGGSARLLD